MDEVHTTVASVHPSNYKQVWSHEHVSNSQICDQERVHLQKNKYFFSIFFPQSMWLFHRHMKQKVYSEFFYFQFLQIWSTKILVVKPG
jgi:hypothetical protein